jgi:hypothetical protein|tara:strand:+ start:704 stop:1060 length:357 start_codon:yes stop_codon:yes gene_type:complete
MKTTIKLIALVVLVLIIVLTYINRAEAGGPWHDQYCDIETTTIRIVDQQGIVIEERTEEKVICQDGAKDFLHGFGIADSCQIYTWDMPLGETSITQRDIACHKMDGGYEIVKGYHGME